MIMSESPSSVIQRLERRRRVAEEVIDGLRGRPFYWGDGEHSAKRPLLADLGVTLVTETRLRKIGRALKRGARPVGSVYFPAPLQRQADVYVLECQTKPGARGPSAPRPIAQCGGCGHLTSDRRAVTCCRGYCLDPTGESCDAWPCPNCGRLHSWTCSFPGDGSTEGQADGQ